MANNKNNKNSEVGAPSNGIKICYLNHDTRRSTGAGRFYNSLSAAIKKEIFGVSVEVLTSENILYPNKLKLLLALPAIRKIIKRCDIVHALDGWPYGIIAAIASIGLKNKLIITAVGTGAVKPLYSWWRRPILKWAYRRADRVAAVSNNTKREVQKFLPNLKIEVINHGVEATKYEKVRIYENYEKLRPYILSVGALKTRKGFEYSIEAFAGVAKKFENLKYVIVGSGPEKENLQLQITNYQLQNRVIFLDNIPEEKLMALYKNAELFILLPQDSNKDIEGFGLVFLEAAAAGLPVVAAKETSAEDATRDGENGILVNPQDTKAASAAIYKILSSPDLKSDMSKNSISFARSMSWEKSARSYNGLYGAIL